MKMMLRLRGGRRTERSSPTSSLFTRSSTSLIVLAFACLLSLQYPGFIVASPSAVPAVLGTHALAGASSPAIQVLNTSASSSSSATQATALYGTLPAGNSVGCFYQKSKNDAWQSVPCVSQSVLDKMTKPQILPTIGGGAGIHGLSVSGKILSEGYTTAWFSAYSGETDTSFGKDSFSIQANTNFFTGSNGQTDWVQFVEQSTPNGNAFSYNCVWNIDVTVAAQTNNKQGYYPTCVDTPIQTLSATFGADVVGTASSKCLYIFGICILEHYLTSTYMTPSGSWSVTASDDYGLFAHWTQISGTILGLGGGSQAVFTHRTEIGSNVGAYSSGLNSVTAINTAVTGESNNLNYQSSSPTCYGDGYCVLWTTMGN